MASGKWPGLQKSSSQRGCKDKTDRTDKIPAILRGVWRREKMFALQLSGSATIRDEKPQEKGVEMMVSSVLDTVILGR